MYSKEQKVKAKQGELGIGRAWQGEEGRGGASYGGIDELHSSITRRHTSWLLYQDKSLAIKCEADCTNLHYPANQTAEGTMKE